MIIDAMMSVLNMRKRRQMIDGRPTLTFGLLSDALRLPYATFATDAFAANNGILSTSSLLAEVCARVSAFILRAL